MYNGACSYLLKDTNSAEVIKCIETVNSGEEYICEIIQKKLKTIEGGEKIIHLRTREKDVLPLIAAGLPDKEIAKQTCMSYHTARDYRTALLEKFNVKTSIELANEAKKKLFI
ncbi:MAG: LuxR C-terminal-related transcriptional regulator [Prevotellaceae bacterium]|jgi:two-component system response regulator DesR|nr:LuxR C-terminal-related transcriptional regulator [Prevotellaceae bacterium]